MGKDTQSTILDGSLYGGPAYLGGTSLGSTGPRPLPWLLFLHFGGEGALAQGLVFFTADRWTGQDGIPRWQGPCCTTDSESVRGVRG